MGRAAVHTSSCRTSAAATPRPCRSLLGAPFTARRSTRPEAQRCCRRAWHLEDKIRLLRTLRWGEIGFANLRHANMVCPEVWNCKWLRLDWRWSGNWLHPRDWDNGTKLQVGSTLTRLRLSWQAWQIQTWGNG